MMQNAFYKNKCWDSAAWDVDFKKKVLIWANQFDRVCCLDSNDYQGDRYASYELLVAAGTVDAIETNTHAFSKLKAFRKQYPSWLFGHLSYELKDELEDLSSTGFDGVQFPILHFFVPQYVIILHKNGNLEIDAYNLNPDIIKNKILKISTTIPPFHESVLIKSRISKDTYLNTVRSLLQHIRKGDIYEVNYCQEFYAENIQLDPLALYFHFLNITRTPFGGFYKKGQHYLLCGSPERFLKKEGRKIIAQPIKGTAKRGKDTEEDFVLMNKLRNSSKDRSENIMIVDLMRNDLARSCVSGSVQVTDLCGIYPFRQVLQMISTIEGQLLEEVSAIDVIERSFPMGSMTGAPKIRSMQLIEQYEPTQRGIYSGAIGYFDPNDDFDFNVVIRSLAYNEQKRYLSFQVGGALVADSQPEQEYAECLLKAKGIFKTLGIEWQE